MSVLKILRRVPLMAATVMLTGCSKMVLLYPSGDVAIQQRDLLVVSTGLLLLIIVPVIVLILLFAWRYRKSDHNLQARYEPDWDHSTQLELVIWAVPLMIIITLGALTWVSTHTLDPFRPLQRLDATHGLTVGQQPLVVDVVALDWKWLFIYPEQGIAVVNQLAAPVDRPITFNITSATVMNSFYIPALAGQIYAMAGMQTQLHAVINKAGQYEGFSANYSGEGFSDMRFTFRGMSSGDFDQWVKTAKADGGELTRAAYLKLEQPTIREPVRSYATVAPGLYDAILNQCVESNKMCMSQMAEIDERGGLGGPEGTYNVASLDSATRAMLGNSGAPVKTYVGAMCTANDPVGASIPRAPPTL
ncbi:MAG: ubiquinol oxidase subunit II [Rhodoferax sp.]